MCHLRYGICTVFVIHVELIHKTEINPKKYKLLVGNDSLKQHNTKPSPPQSHPIEFPSFCYFFDSCCQDVCQAKLALM